MNNKIVADENVVDDALLIVDSPVINLLLQSAAQFNYIVINTKHQVIEINDDFLKLLGDMPKEWCVGKPLCDLLIKKLYPKKEVNKSKELCQTCPLHTVIEEIVEKRISIYKKVSLSCINDDNNQVQIKAYPFLIEESLFIAVFVK